MKHLWYPFLLFLELTETRGTQTTITNLVTARFKPRLVSMVTAALFMVKKQDWNKHVFSWCVITESFIVFMLLFFIILQMKTTPCPLKRTSRFSSEALLVPGSSCPLQTARDLGLLHWSSWMDRYDKTYLVDQQTVSFLPGTSYRSSWLITLSNPLNNDFCNN